MKQNALRGHAQASRPHSCPTQRSSSIVGALALSAAVGLAGVLLPRPASAQTAKAGLDALSDEPVMTELSSLKLDSLLTHLFDADRVPQDQRESIKSLGALRELSSGVPISDSRRIELLRQAVDGLTALLPTIKDPATLMDYVGPLIAKGIEPDVHTLEYWGDNPVIDARLQPACQMAAKMLEQAKQEAAKQEVVAGNNIKTSNDAASQLYDKLDSIKTNAEYLKNYFAYYQALSVETSNGTNAAAVKERDKICDDALKYFTSNNLNKPGADNGGLQPLVLNRMGQLQMVKGDYAAARANFEAEAAGKTPDGAKIDPAPDIAHQYEARFFLAVCDVLAKRPADAEKDLDALLAWQKTSLPAADQAQVGAAAQILRYRILSTKADLAKDPAEKEKANREADAVLNELGKIPGFEKVITEQLVNRLPANAKLDDQGSAVLNALYNKGLGEYYKPANVPMDPAVVARAIEAARVLVSKQATLGISQASVEEYMLFIGAMYEKEKKPLEAAQTFLEYAKRFPASAKSAGAMGEAVTLAYNLYHGPEKTDSAVRILYGNVLAAATGKPWSRSDLYFLYAEYLRSIGKPTEAVAWYRLVPAGNKMEYAARFLELASIASELDEPKLAPAERAKAMTEGTALVDVIRRLAPTAEQNATTAEQKNVVGLRLLESTVIGAQIALDEKQPDRALALLANFEQVASSVPGAPDLLQEVTRFRARAYIDKKQFDKATDEVVNLSKTSPAAAEGLAIGLMSQLDKDYERYTADNQQEEKGETARNEARLTDFMVSFCKTSKVKAISDLLPTFELYDAKMKLRAGTDLTDPKAKAVALAAAAAAYTHLRDANPADPNAQLGLGLTAFARQDWKAAFDALGTLIYGGKLGGPQKGVTDKITGQYELKENEIFWEAEYKWLKSGVEWARANPKDPNSAAELKAARQTIINLFTTYGDATGGADWGPQMLALRKDLAPDYSSAVVNPTTQTSAPSTGPTTAPSK